MSTDILTQAHINRMYELEPMIRKAEDEGKWLVLLVAFDGYWYSPRELRANNAIGECCFSPENLRLDDPLDHLIALEARALEAQDDVVAFANRLAAEGMRPEDVAGKIWGTQMMMQQAREGRLNES